MAQDHLGEDTLRPAAAKPERARESAWMRQRMRVAVAGINVWIVGALWPAWIGGPHWADPLPLVALLGGVAALGRERGTPWPPGSPPWTPQVLLLGVFPGLLALSVAVSPATRDERAFGPMSLGLVLLSLLAFGAWTTAASSGRSQALEADHTSLHDAAAAPRARALRRTAYITIVIVGAFAIGVVAPRLGGRARYREAWGDAAIEGGLLTAVVAVGAAVGIVGLLLGDALRANQPIASVGRSRGARVASLLLLTLLGAVTYFVVSD